MKADEEQKLANSFSKENNSSRFCELHGGDWPYSFGTEVKVI